MGRSFAQPLDELEQGLLEHLAECWVHVQNVGGQLVDGLALHHGLNHRLQDSNGLRPDDVHPEKRSSLRVGQQLDEACGALEGPTVATSAYLRTATIEFTWRRLASCSVMPALAICGSVNTAYGASSSDLFRPRRHLQAGDGVELEVGCRRRSKTEQLRR